MASFLPVCFFSVVLAKERQETGVSFNMECWNNYWSPVHRLDCEWHQAPIRGEEPFYLNFSDPLNLQTNLICNFSASPVAQDLFTCSVEEVGEGYTENDEYSVSLHTTFLGETITYLVFPSYEPRLHIVCDPPWDLRSSLGSGKYRIDWKMPYEDITFKEWKWEMAFKEVEAPWEEAQTKVFDRPDMWVELESVEFKPDVDYIARIRCKTSDASEVYQSQWSRWSATTTWKTLPGHLQRQEHLDSLLTGEKVYLALCPTFLLLFLLLAIGYLWRAKGNDRAQIPSPAAFFQSLYLSHNGDFKHWVGLPEKAAWLRGNREEKGPGGPNSDNTNEAVDVSSAPFFNRLSKEQICPLHEMPGSQCDIQGMKQENVPLACRRGPEPLLLRGGDSAQLKRQKAGKEGCSLPLQRKDASWSTEQPTWESEIFFGTSDYCSLRAGVSQETTLVPKGPPQSSSEKPGQTTESSLLEAPWNLLARGRCVDGRLTFEAQAKPCAVGTWDICLALEGDPDGEPESGCQGHQKPRAEAS